MKEVFVRGRTRSGAATGLRRSCWLRNKANGTALLDEAAMAVVLDESPGWLERYRRPQHGLVPESATTHEIREELKRGTILRQLNQTMQGHDFDIGNEQPTRVLLLRHCI